MGVYKVGEVIKYTRESLSITQEELSSGICSPEQLSRIENGKHSPSRATFEALMERMGKPGQRYLPFIRSGDIKVHLEKQRLDLLSKNHDYERLDAALDAFEHSLNMDDPVNRQYVLRARAMTEYRLHRIDIKEQRRRLVEALRCTIPFYQEGVVPKGFFGRHEIVILCNIAMTYYEEKNFESAIDQLLQIKDYFQKVSIDLQERTVTEVLLLSNLGQCLGNVGRVSEAKELNEKAKKLAILGNNGGNLTYHLYNIAFANELLGEDASMCKEQLTQAYYIAELCENVSTKKHIETHIKKIYGEDFVELV